MWPFLYDRAVGKHASGVTVQERPVWSNIASRHLWENTRSVKSLPKLPVGYASSVLLACAYRSLSCLTAATHSSRLVGAPPAAACVG